MNILYFGFVYLLFVSNVLQSSQSQNLVMNRQIANQDLCSNGKTALVEQFFNLVFTEFQKTPPVCVCVQMCPDQLTYCYPNGCYKQSRQKRKEEFPQAIPMPPPPPKEQPKKLDQPSYFDDPSSQMSHFLTESSDYSKGATQRPELGDISADPFGERYKILFGFKKGPKVELRYNLREQVKNMKSNRLNMATLGVSNTRWPLNKRKSVNVQNVYNTIKSNDLRRSISKNLIAPNYYVDPVMSRYFKRHINPGKDDVDYDFTTESLAKYLEYNRQNTNFSLENLIDNLIESSIDRVNKSDFLENLSIKFVVDNDSNIINEMTPSTDDLLDLINNSNNFSTTIKPHNSENNDKSIYNQESTPDNYKNVFNEMIATLTRSIDKQNNTSLEKMDHAINVNKQIITEKYEVDDKLVVVNNTVVTVENSTQNLFTTTENRYTNSSTEKIPEGLTTDNALHRKQQ